MSFPQSRLGTPGTVSVMKTQLAFAASLCREIFIHNVRDSKRISIFRKLGAEHTEG
jgi:hypothetical protein